MVCLHLLPPKPKPAHLPSLSATQSSLLLENALKLSIYTSLTTRSKSNKSLIDYPNTAGVAVQLQSLRPQKLDLEIQDTAHQLTLTQMSTDIENRGRRQ